MELLIVFLIVLQLKHFYLDFIDQTEKELKYKGVYFDIRGMTHSIKHGVCSFFCALIVLDLEMYYFMLSVLVGMLDFILHYHIDYIKSSRGPKDMNSKEFWIWFGGDQFAHQLTYILLVLTIF